jgi:hypothetical protein
MSDNLVLQNSREYRFKEWLKYTRTRPFACQSLMKNFWQCFDHYRFTKSEEEGEAKSKCLEKFNYSECFIENKEKLLENWPLNVQIYDPSGSGGEEEDEE